jgi:hypothetical protein
LPKNVELSDVLCGIYQPAATMNWDAFRLLIWCNGVIIIALVYHTKYCYHGTYPYT